MSGTGQLILYLDFDGVLHHANCRGTPGGDPFLDAPPRYTLFQHAGLLSELLAPYPDVKIVLSTTWAVRLGVQHATSRLPDAIATRVIGSTFSASVKPLYDFFALPRGVQVSEDAANRRPRAWLALDDDADGWPRKHRAQLIKTDPYEGISKPAVRAEFERKLKEMCS
jgi:hypothetical protein